jgi:hypothetical protein
MLMIVSAFSGVVIGNIATFLYFFIRDAREHNRGADSLNKWLQEEAKRRGTDTWSN